MRKPGAKIGAMWLLAGGLALTLTLSLAFYRLGQAQETYSPYVDATGGIEVAADYRTKWVFLGTWVVAAGEGPPGARQIHNVYTQPGVVDVYRNSGNFPDGAVLIKELLGSETRPMTTGTVSHGVGLEGWFVMVKDSKNRFPGNMLWGDGWGWALFSPDGTLKTTDYKTECLGCHLPAKNTDWVYVEGYSPLR